MDTQDQIPTPQAPAPPPCHYLRGGTERGRLVPGSICRWPERGTSPSPLLLVAVSSCARGWVGSGILLLFAPLISIVLYSIVFAALIKMLSSPHVA